MTPFLELEVHLPVHLKGQIVTLASVDSKVSLSSSPAITLQFSPVQPLYHVRK